jgi:hypothetical protein
MAIVIRSTPGALRQGRSAFARQEAMTTSTYRPPANIFTHARQEALTTSVTGYTPPRSPVYYNPPYYAPAPPPVPPPPPPPPPRLGNQAIKIATNNLFIRDSTVPPERIVELTFEQIGGTQLAQLVRTDSVDGIDQEYLPIANLASTNLQSDPYKIIALQNVNEEYFDQFEIILDDYTPSIGTGPTGEIIYIDTDSSSSTYSNLVVNTVNLKPNQKVETEFLSYSLVNDIII